MESRCHRGSGRVSVGGVHGVGRRYPGVPVFKQLLSRSELAGNANPVVRVLHKAAPRRMTGQEAPGMSWSTVVASLRLNDGTVPRAQGQMCGQHVVAPSGIPTFAGPRLSLLRCASWDELRWSPQDGVKADPGSDGPVGVAAVPCGEPEPLMSFCCEGQRCSSKT